MKKILLGFIAIGLITFVVSCQKSKKELLSEFRKSELKTGVKKDSLILGYAFGMSPKQFNEHTNQLLKQKNIEQVDDNLLFKLKISDKLVTFTYNVKFYNDKLNFFRAESKDLSDVELNSFLKESYGNYQFLIEEDYGGKDYYWISGNREIRTTSWQGKTILMFDDESNQELVDASKAINELDDNSTNARAMIWDFVKQRLKNPSSAKFGRFTPKKSQSGSWISKSYVDSQNSFGATIRTNFNCEIKYNTQTKSWELLSLKTY